MTGVFGASLRESGDERDFFVREECFSEERVFFGVFLSSWEGFGFRIFAACGEHRPVEKLCFNTMESLILAQDER